jgi:internalin A
MKRIFVFLLVLVVVGISQAAPVVFNDPNLKTAVETTLGIPNPEPADMLLLTTLDANHLGILDLTGLDYATNLTILRLSNNNLGNIDLLAGLTKMKNLYLDGNPSINSLFAIGDMNDLRYLKAYGCSISNINVAANFKKLEGLSLSGNNFISNITPIKDINTLRYVYLAGNNISDINAFKDPDMNSLIELDLADNFISEVNSLSGLTKLTFLSLRYNDLGDINPLSGMTKLIYLYLSFNESITDINALAGMKKLVELGLTDDNLSDISVLADINQTKILWLGYNLITDINSLTKDTNLITLSLSYNPLSFQSWCIYLRQIRANNPAAAVYTVPAANGLVDTSSTDFSDLRILATQWLQSGCNTDNAYCKCSDLNESGTVNFRDYVIFADWWMLLP